MEYTILEVKKGKAFKDDPTIFNYYLTLEDYPNQVNLGAKIEPKAGDKINGTISSKEYGGKTYYTIKKDKAPRPEYKDDDARIVSFATSYAKEMVLRGVVPFFQKGYTMGDMVADIVACLKEQTSPMSLVDRSAYISYAIDLLTSDVKNDIDTLLSKVSDTRTVRFNDVDVEVKTIDRVLALYKSIFKHANNEYIKLKSGKN